jgi:hypothetical protein
MQSDGVAVGVRNHSEVAGVHADGSLRHEDLALGAFDATEHDKGAKQRQPTGSVMIDDSAEPDSR